MQRLIVIFILTYYCLGALFLPQGNFSVLADIRGMYQHCKATEDKDMTPLDFITDHLINIDGIFDEHDNGDDQKPHSPSTTDHQQAQVFCTWLFFDYSFVKPRHEEKPIFFNCSNFYCSSYLANIFKPPIV